MKEVRRYIRTLLVLLLMLIVGTMNEAQAAKVTYHILTLPIDSVNRYNYHMKAAVHGYRLEAFKVVVDKQSTYAWFAVH